MDEPQFTNPPMVIDRRDRVWVKVTTRTWRWTKVRQSGRLRDFYLVWEALDEFCGPLTLAPAGTPVPPSEEGTEPPSN